jgi:LemA protein
MIGVWIALGIIVVLILAIVALYNGLVRLRNEVKNAWAQIDVHAQQRRL